VDGRQAPLGLRLHTQHNFPQGFLQAALSSFSLIKHEVLRQPVKGLRQPATVFSVLSSALRVTLSVEKGNERITRNIQTQLSPRCSLFVQEGQRGGIIPHV